MFCKTFIFFFISFKYFFAFWWENIIGSNSKKDFNEDDLYLTLAGSVNNYDKECEAQYGGLITVPKCAIQKRWCFPRSFLYE